MIFAARKADLMAMVGIVGLRLLKEVEAAVEPLAVVRVTPASVDCEEGCAPKMREGMVESERGVEGEVLRRNHGRSTGDLGELVKMLVGTGSTATAIEPRRALNQTW